MFTHLFVGREGAAKLFLAYAPKPLEEGQMGLIVEADLDQHFNRISQVPLRTLDATMERTDGGEEFILKFRRYLAHLPSELLMLEVKVLGAEIVRVNSTPTKARNGYYEDEVVGFTAVVEGVTEKGSPSQNITVTATTLEAAQTWHTRLVRGRCRRQLVNAFG